MVPLSLKVSYGRRASLLCLHVPRSFPHRGSAGWLCSVRCVTRSHVHVVVSQGGDCANHQKHCMILGQRYASMQSCFDSLCLASVRTACHSFDAPRAVGAKASFDVIMLGRGCLVSVRTALHSFGVPLSLTGQRHASVPPVCG